jgi:hypothetical protein
LTRKGLRSLAYSIALSSGNPSENHDSRQSHRGYTHTCIMCG